MYLKNLISTISVLFALSFHAFGLIQTPEYRTETNQTVTAETWVLCTSAAPQGTFKNDLFIGAANQLTLDGTYEGNVWAGSAASTVTLNGVCKRNVRLAGSDVHINGIVEGNLTVSALYSITIGTNALIKGSVQLHCLNSIIQEGTIGGPAVFNSAKSVTINGPIMGDTNVNAPEIVLARNARIEGNLTYQSSRDLFPATGIISGKLKRVLPPSPYSLERAGRHAIAFFAAFLVGLPFLSLFPTTTALSTLLIRKSPLKCILVGFVALFALPFLGMISISSAFGLPLGALILISWGALIYLSRIVVGLIIGTVILRSGNASAGRLLLSLLLGLAVIYTLTFIPSTIGLIAQMAVIWIGSGALLLTLSQRRRMAVKFAGQVGKIEETLNSKNNTTTEEL
ncbi:MAG: hypothetical protein GXY61_07110 [Lentisphaerae bacterium]|nr:hypothetical protein [Lentisphaerota bacterium]